jgi:hypothetical protein
MFQIMAYIIVVLKNILYNLKSLFKKVQKEELMKDTISTGVFNLTQGEKKSITMIRIKFEKSKFNS